MNKKFERARQIFSKRLGLDLTSDEVRFLLAKHGRSVEKVFVFAF